MTAPPDHGDSRPIDFPFLLLAAVFLASLVTCNLIANKFLTVDLGFKVFTLSAGALPYPVTFLARPTCCRRSTVGAARTWSCCRVLPRRVFTLLALALGSVPAAIPDSPVSSEQ